MSYYFGNWETRGKYCHLELKCTQASRHFLRMHIKKQHLNRTDTYSLIWTPPVMINIDCARIYFHKKKHSYIYQRNKQGWLFSGTMSHLVTSNAAFLKILYSTDIKKKKSFNKNHDRKSTAGIVWGNFKCGQRTFPLTKYYIKRLSPHQQVIHKLSSKTVKKSVKRKLLLQQNTIIPILIKPALSVLNYV